MKKVIKRISSIVIALTITLSMCVTCFAGKTWESYFGQDGSWFEGSAGVMTKSTPAACDLKISAIGWGGIWGCQIHKDVTVKKGSRYALSFKMKATNVEKWVFFKVTDDDDNTAYADWIKLVPGVTKNYKAIFKSNINAKYIYFGLGGEMGDRADEVAIYDYLDQKPNDVDSTYSTDISMTNFKLVKSKAKVKAAKIKGKATKAKKAKSYATGLYNYLKKNGKIKRISGGYVCTYEVSKKNILITVTQANKKIASAKVSKSKPAKALKKLKRSAPIPVKKALNSVLKTETKLTLKKLGY